MIISEEFLNFSVSIRQLRQFPSSKDVFQTNIQYYILNCSKYICIVTLECVLQHHLPQIYNTFHSVTQHVEMALFWNPNSKSKKVNVLTKNEISYMSVLVGSYGDEQP